MLIRILLILLVLLIGMPVLGWLGLQIKAPRFPAVAAGETPPRVPIPDRLPAPLARYARALYGDSLPQVKSAVVVGRARLAPTGLPMPARFRFYYEAAGAGYYHDIEVTWFTLKVMAIAERNLGGHTTLDLSIIGKVDDQPQTNRAAIQGYWAEVLVWVPAIALLDARVEWAAVDENTARMILPGLAAEEAFTLTFDPAGGLLRELETYRYRAEEDNSRHRWFSRVVEWGTRNGQPVAVRADLQWDDEAPWAKWEVEQVALNAEVDARLAQFGGKID